MLTYNSICDKPLENVVQELVTEFCVDIPTNVESYDEMVKAGNLLGELTNSYSYMVALLMMLKAGTRSLKRDKEKKDEYDDMVGKRDAVDEVKEEITEKTTTEINTVEIAKPNKNKSATNILKIIAFTVFGFIGACGVGFLGIISYCMLKNRVEKEIKKCKQ